MNKVSPIGNAVKGDTVKGQFIEKMHTICGSKTFYKAMNKKGKDELFTKIYNVLYEGIDSNKKTLYGFFALKKSKDEINLLNNKINIELNNFLKNDDSIQGCFNGFIKEKALLLSPITTIEKRINSQKRDIKSKEQNFSTDIKNKKQILLKKTEDNKKYFLNEQQINTQLLKKMESDKKSSLEVIKKEEQQSIENIDKKIDNIDKKLITEQLITNKRIESLILLLKKDCDNILIENIQMTIGSWLKKDNKDLSYKETNLKELYIKLYKVIDKESDVDRLSGFKEYFIDNILPCLVTCFGDSSISEDIYNMGSIGGKKKDYFVTSSNQK
jgi:hypothetical protein